MVGTVRGGGVEEVSLTVGDCGEDVCGKSGFGGTEDNGTFSFAGRDCSVTGTGGRLADECSGDDDDACAEFSIEDRVHKHGCPDGDPRALTSGSIVFSLPLWRAVGLVPKAMNFQCNDLPPPVGEDVDIQQMLLRPEPIEKIIERERIRFKMRLQLGKQQAVIGGSVSAGGFHTEYGRSQQQASDERDSVGGAAALQTCVRMDSPDQASCLARGDEVDGARFTGAERLDEREAESLSRQGCENGALPMALDCTNSESREVPAVAIPESIRSGVTSSREPSFEGDRSKAVVADMGQDASERRFYSLEREVVTGGNDEALLYDSVHPAPSSRVVGGGASSTLVSEQRSSCLCYLNPGVDSHGAGNDDTFPVAQKKLVANAELQRAQDCGAVDQCAASPSRVKVARGASVGKECGSSVGRFCFNCSCENTALSSGGADCSADTDRAAFRAAGELGFDSCGDRDVSCIWLCSACGDLFSKKRGVCPSGSCCPQSVGSGDGDSLKSTRGRSRMSCSVCQRWCHTRCAERKKEKVERASSSSGSSHDYFCVDCERMTLRLRSLRQVVLSSSNGTFTQSNIQAMEDLEQLRKAVRTAVGRRKGVSSSDEVVMGTDGRSCGRAIEPRRRDVSHEESDNDSSAAVDSGPQKRRRKENHDQTGHGIGSAVLTNIEASCPVQEEYDSGVGKAGYFSENEALSPRGGGQIHGRLSPEMTEAADAGGLHQKAQLMKASSMDSLGNRMEWERSRVSNGDGRRFELSHDVEAAALGEFQGNARSASPSSPASLSVSSRLFHGGRAEQGEEIDISNEGVTAERVETGGGKADGEHETDVVGQLEGSLSKVMSHNFSADGASHSTEWGNGGSCNVDAVPSSPLESLAAVAVNGLDGGLQESRSSSPHTVHMLSTSTVLGDGDVCNERLVSIEEGGEDVVWRHYRSTHGGSSMELNVRPEEVGCGGDMVQHMVGSSHSAFSSREQSPDRSDDQDHHINQQPLRPRHGNMLPEAEEQALNQHRQRRSGHPHVYFAADQDDSRHSADQNLPHHVMRGRTDTTPSGLRSVLSSGIPQRPQSRLTLSARVVSAGKNGSATSGIHAGSVSGPVGKPVGERDFAMPHISSVKQVASGARKSPQVLSATTHKAVVISGPVLSKPGSGRLVQGKTSSGANGIVPRQSSLHPSAKPPLSSSRSKVTVSATKLTVQQSAKSCKSDLPDAARAVSTSALNVTRPCSSNNCSPSNCPGAGSSPSGIAQSNGGSRHVSSQGSGGKVSSAKISLQTSANGSKHCALVTIASSKNGVSSTAKPVPVVGSGKQSYSHSPSPKHSSLPSGLKSVSTNSVRSVKDECSRKPKGEHSGVARTSIGMKPSVASMPPPPPQHGHKRLGGSAASILTPMNDEEYAKLLHHELNSSPRMPRMSRVSSTGSMGQQRISGNGHVQTLTPAKRLPSNQNGNSSGHHHDQQVSRKRPKEENARNGSGRHTSDNTLDEGGGAGTQVKKGVACNGGVGECRNEVSKRGADEPESFGDGHDGNGVSSFSMVGGGAEKGLPENDGEAGKSEVSGAMMTASPHFEDGLVMSGEFEKSGRPSRSSSGERKTSGEGKPVTLPVVIEEEIQASSCSTLSFEVICSAVSHWANGGPKRRRMSSPSNSEDEGESGCYQRHLGPMEKGVSCHKSQQGANGAGGDQRRENGTHDGEKTTVVKENEHREQVEAPVVKRSEETEVRKGKRKARRRRLLQKDGGATSEADKENASIGGGERRNRSRGKDPGQEVESEPPSSSSDEDAVSNYSEDDEEMVGHVKFGARTRRCWHRRHSAVCSDSSRDDEGPCR
ncbi:hypothetical protein CBR_g32513 [Chara braunii]|uniref:PHD-type domain-containing protein n=1 Tax=Chara braunii TaxID=69332 RepID=A0A388LGZ7_CHABU|nr:hypothetical protein CBR_g32513 [Chara braunii]|eukprot:GBG81525.1 hypothetical protein CBR_g32513 [Chara braunii]